MASAKDTGVVYVRLSEAEKELLEDVRTAVGVSQNAYARSILLAALERDRVKYADVIARQRELRGEVA